jgi:SAM-dependent methyltransferase
VTGVDKSAELVALAARRAQQSGAGIAFACADFTRGWRPPRRADGVLCRGVLNDLLRDDDRLRAFESFAAWLRPGGVLIADVRECEASSRRYAAGRKFERTVHRGYDTLNFSSITTIEPGSDMLLLIERWVGTVGRVPVDEESSFRMRCWTWDSLEHAARTAGFRRFARVEADDAGARGDRLVAVGLR